MNYVKLPFNLIANFASSFATFAVKSNKKRLTVANLLHFATQCFEFYFLSGLSDFASAEE